LLSGAANQEQMGALLPEKGEERARLLKILNNWDVAHVYA
jgi:hypothetical protein